MFLGQSGQRTLFMVQPPHNGVNIQRYSAYSGEDEVRREAAARRGRGRGCATWDPKQTPHLPLARWHGIPATHAMHRELSGSHRFRVQLACTRGGITYFTPRVEAG